MSSWHRENPELAGTDADPWMANDAHRQAFEELVRCGIIDPPGGRDERLRGAPASLSLEAALYPGCGGVTLTRDGIRVEWGGQENAVAQDAEDRAAGDPCHDWRIRVDAPLYDATYQRQGEGQWVLVERGQGFA